MSGNRWGLSVNTIEAIQNILSREPAVHKAILFGSRAKGNFKPGSDIDLAIVGEEVNLDTISRLHRAFEESTIPYEVDLCWLAQVDQPALREHIARVGQLVYERNA
jgi:predicted nucleotidyltransferase